MSEVELLGVKLRYRSRGETIMPEDDNNKLEVLSRFCQKMLDILEAGGG